MESITPVTGIHTVISKEAKFGKNCVVGSFCFISEDVEIGDDVQIGDYCKINSNVRIANNTKIQSYVEIRTNTRIGSDCYIDSYVAFSGNSIIGNSVTLRYCTIIARGVHVGDNTYICPRVMTNNLDATGKQIGGAKIGADCFIGTAAVLNHGIVIEDKVVVGSMSFVNQNCEEGKTYVGIPAKELIKE